MSQNNIKPSDILSLQNALNQTLIWSDVIKRPAIQSIQVHLGKDFGFHNFIINGMTIIRTDCIKDLGINISSSLLCSNNNVQ